MQHEDRARKLNQHEHTKGPALYWMSRDQRVKDNWALLDAQEKALDSKSPLVVCFCLVPEFMGATIRQYDFMIRGLKEVESTLRSKNISFHVLLGDPGIEIPKFVNKIKAGVLLTDFDPLKIKSKWKRTVKSKIEIPFYEVDTHNIIPVWDASDKKEFAARTIRPKINKLLPKYLTKFPTLKKQSSIFLRVNNDWSKIYKSLKVDNNVEAVEWLKPGEKEAKKVLSDFIKNKLSAYDKYRNDPNKDYQSNLSPYLHFGQISAQRVALELKRVKGNKKNKEAFLEELIVRKELSDNFCYYEKNYDRYSGFHEWAQKTLSKHKKDKRKYLYSLKKLENADTHDDAWNAAQNEMVKRGKMHGYMRMYWAKKILEWTKSPEQALKFAIYLNDKYELDGRDPNGYTGIAWSIGGIHDRAWSERYIFGKIRFMNYEGLKRKFKVDKYVQKVKNL